MATAETEAPAPSESRRQQLLPRAYGRARLPSTLLKTTYVYLHADLKLKEQAMARTETLQMWPIRYRPDDMLAFLNNL